MFNMETLLSLCCWLWLVMRKMLLKKCTSTLQSAVRPQCVTLKKHTTRFWWPITFPVSGQSTTLLLFPSKLFVVFLLDYWDIYPLQSITKWLQLSNWKQYICPLVSQLIYSFQDTGCFNTTGQVLYFHCTHFVLGRFGIYFCPWEMS